MYKKPIEILEKYFGYKEFRKGQEEIINSILNKKDVIAIMPTGGVNNENMLDWINAGADCIGIGSDLNKVFKNFGKNGVIEYCKNLI